MSEIVPNHDSLCHSQLAPFAFQSLNGLQAGQVFTLDSSKTVLQFDSADGSKHSPPTRCLVIQGPNGVAVRTIQGEMAVNDCIQHDGWLNVNDELSCGNARLRLVRQVELVGANLKTPTRHATPHYSSVEFASHSSLPSELENVPDAQAQDGVDSVLRSTALDPLLEDRQIIADDLEHDTRCDATNDPNSPESANPPPSRFFSPFTFDDGSDSSEGGQTMCLSPEELRGLLEPTVYGADDVGYVDSSSVDSPTRDAAETPREASCDSAAETCNPFNSETQPTAAIEPEPAVAEDFLLLPCNAETVSQQGNEASPGETLVPTIDGGIFFLPQCGHPSCSHVEIVDFGVARSGHDFFHQVVGWPNQEPCTNRLPCDLKLQTDVHGVIIH